MPSATAFLLFALPAFADWQASYQKGEQLLQAGRANEAVQELQSALTQAGAGSRGAVLDALGRAEFQAGHYREAKRHFEQSLALWDGQPRERAIVLSSAGRVYLALGEYNRAESTFLKAVEFLPGEARVWQSLGQSQFLQGRHREAEETYQKALSLADRMLTPSISSDLAAVLKAKHQYAKAAGVLRESIAQDSPGRARARMRANLGALYWKLRDREPAVAQLQLALSEMESAVGHQHPDVAMILDDYQVVLRGTGKKKEASAAAERAVAIRSSFARHTNDSRTVVDWRDLK